MANDQVKLTGLADIQSADVTQTDDLSVTDAAAIGGILSVSGAAIFSSSVRLGTTNTAVVGFFGSAGVSQPAGASQAAVSLQAPVSITASQYGFATSTQIQHMLNFIQEARSAMVRTGMIAGA